MIKARYWENSYPYVLGAMVGMVLWYFDITPVDGKFETMLNSAISVSAILLGFLGTAKAMLLSFRSAKFTWMKSNKVVWPTLLRYLRSALFSSLIVCLCSLILLALPIKSFPIFLASLVVPIWAFAFLVSVLTFYRVVSIFFVLLTSE